MSILIFLTSFAFAQTAPVPDLMQVTIENKTIKNDHRTFKKGDSCGLTAGNEVKVLKPAKAAGKILVRYSTKAKYGDDLCPDGTEFEIAKSDFDSFSARYAYLKKANHYIGELEDIGSGERPADYKGHKAGETYLAPENYSVELYVEMVNPKGKIRKMGEKCQVPKGTPLKLLGFSEDHEAALKIYEGNWEDPSNCWKGSVTFLKAEELSKLPKK